MSNPAGPLARPRPRRRRVEARPPPRQRASVFPCRAPGLGHARVPDENWPSWFPGEQSHVRRLFPEPSPGTTAPTAVVPRKTRDQPRAAEYLFGNTMRKQYHIRDSERGLLAWDVDRLIRLTSKQEPVDVLLESIRELDENFWFSGDGDTPSCRRVAEHARLINETDLGHPVILDPDGRVMDGMHRVCKALIHGSPTIKAVRFSAMPEPDFVDVPIDELPYETAELGAAPNGGPAMRPADSGAGGGPPSVS